MHVIKDTNTDNQLTLHTIKVIQSSTFTPFHSTYLWPPKVTLCQVKHNIYGWGDA